MSNSENSLSQAVRNLSKQTNDRVSSINSFLMLLLCFTFQYELIQRTIAEYIDSNEELSEYKYEQPKRCTELSSETILSDSQQLLMSTYSTHEEMVNSLIGRMKMEKQRMKKELESMEHGDERMKYKMKYKIMLMKHREKRIEHEIDLMKRRRKLLDTVIFVQTPNYNNENSLVVEIDLMKKREEHMICENTRMYHYKVRLENEIRTIKLEIENMRTSSITEERYSRHLERRNSLHHAATQPINYNIRLKKLYNELTKRDMKLKEHSNEIKKRGKKLEEHRNKRIECEDKLTKLRHRIQQERYMMGEAIMRRKRYERELIEYRIKRIKCEIDLLSYTAERISCEMQPAKDNEKVRRLHEELSLEVEKLYTLSQHEHKKLVIREEYSECHYEKQNFRRECQERQLIPFWHTIDEISVVIEQPKYDIFISYAYRDDFTIGRIKNALPQSSSTHVKNKFSSTNIKICLDNTSSAAIAIINRTYELSTICQADMIHIFKRQFPLILIISDRNFQPKSDWLTIVWHAPSTQKVFLKCSDFEENLRNALTDTQWNLSPKLNTSKPIQSTKDERSKRFLGDHHEWTVAYNNPAQVSQHYRQLISDPLQIATDTKLQNIYYNYIRIYFENSEVISLFEEAAMSNYILDFIRGYTVTKSFTEILNSHLAANILFYFESTLYNNVDYQLIKSTTYRIVKH